MVPQTICGRSQNIKYFLCLKEPYEKIRPKLHQPRQFNPQIVPISALSCVTIFFVHRRIMSL